MQHVLCSQSNAVYKEHAYDPSDVVTLMVGKHILHFGGEFLIYPEQLHSLGQSECRHDGIYGCVH